MRHIPITQIARTVYRNGEPVERIVAVSQWVIYRTFKSRPGLAYYVETVDGRYPKPYQRAARLERGDPQWKYHTWPIIPA